MALRRYCWGCLDLNPYRRPRLAVRGSLGCSVCPPPTHPKSVRPRAREYGMAKIKRYPVIPEPERFVQGRVAHAVESRREFGIAYERVKSDYRGLARGAIQVDNR